MSSSRDIMADFSEWLIVTSKAVGNGPLYIDLVKLLLRLEMLCGKGPFSRADVAGMSLSCCNAAMEALHYKLQAHLNGDRRLPLENIWYNMTEKDTNKSIRVGSNTVEITALGSTARARVKMYLEKLALAEFIDIVLLLRLTWHISTGSKEPVADAVSARALFSPDYLGEYRAKLEQLYLRLNGLLQERGLPDLLPLAELQAEADQINAKLGVVCTGAKPVSAPSFGLDAN